MACSESDATVKRLLTYLANSSERCTVGISQWSSPQGLGFLLFAAVHANSFAES